MGTDPGRLKRQLAVNRPARVPRPVRGAAGAPPHVRDG